ncbi:hypothetical protein DSO57_1015151 [Entomophthora muscae]|uniref:Uncharacterized protein n=1 Tax=Entomophthora muscae TaxID=34485 RepID=A0ACC2UR11_9FUNG|nr:hypothetical protein DSO57_1015151 [Entomophthora muscae]
MFVVPSFTMTSAFRSMYNVLIQSQNLVGMPTNSGTTSAFCDSLPALYNILNCLNVIPNELAVHKAILTQVECLCCNRHKPVVQDPVFQLFGCAFLLKDHADLHFVASWELTSFSQAPIEEVDHLVASRACSRQYNSTGRLSGPGAVPFGTSFRVALTSFRVICATKSFLSSSPHFMMAGAAILQRFSAVSMPTVSRE